MSDHYNPVLKALTLKPLVPVLTLHDVDYARQLIRKLFKQGYTVVEATLRTDQALAAMQVMKAAVPDLMIGMGTVLTVEDMEISLKSGADFLVTPATSPGLIGALKHSSVPVFPGVATPSEALHLYEAGFRYQKFFPAEANGGVRALKSWSDPMPEIRFIPTGGIRETTCQAYLELPNVIAVGGSWMAGQ